MQDSVAICSLFSLFQYCYKKSSKYWPLNIIFKKIVACDIWDDFWKKTYDSQFHLRTFTYIDTLTT
jgi:hypothetical protein